MIATDMLYFAVARDGLDGGVEITASHNPKQYNGMKLVRQEAFPLSGDAGINDIRDMIAAGRLPPPAARRGAVTTRDTLGAYVDHVMSFIDPRSSGRSTSCSTPAAAWAGSSRRGSSSGSPARRRACVSRSTAAFRITRRIRSSRKTAATSSRRVVAEKADVGIAWDGDADRCFFIDGSGEFVSGDFITTLLAEAFLLKDPGATIIYDLRASYAVKDMVAHGGTALMNRVGHAFFKKRMRETNAIFGGEVTGHYYFRDNFYADNGFIPALLILELMSKKGKSLHELLEPLRKKYFISGEINTKLPHMDAVPARLAKIAARYNDGHQYELDGLSVEYPDWHFNVRPSNTEPLLRLNLEAKDAALMARKRDEVLALIRV